MSTTNKGLGRGLDALFGGNAQPDGTTFLTTTLPAASLTPNPHQPRQHFDPDSLAELAESIKMQGIIQPLLVRPRADGKTWEIVAGERRWRAAQLAGLEELPVFVRDLSDTEVMAAALIENLQREDLNPMEEAQALHELRGALNLTQEEVAARLGKSRPTVTNALRLLQLPSTAQTNLRNGSISAGHARCLLGIEGAEPAEELCKRIITHKLTVREAEEAVSAWKKSGTFPWETSDDADTTTPRTSRKKSPEMRKLQKNLSQSLNCTVAISGDTSAGRISLTYASKTQFNALLEILKKR